MPLYESYGDDDSRFDVVLYEEEPSDHPAGAELKAAFEARVSGLSSAEQPLRTIDEDVGDNTLTVQCDIAQVIHGTMVENGSPATLIVFQFVFLPRSNSRRFKEATVTITFSAGNVEKITPYNTWAMFRSEKEQKVSHSISPSLEAAFGPGKATMGYTWQKESSITTQGYAKVEGLTRALGSARYGDERINTVIWTLRENNTEEVKSGIPSFVQTAVLLKRERAKDEPLGAKFSADMVIRGEVDNHEWVKNKWQKAVKGMRGRRRKGEDVIFNPKLNRGTVKDVHNLREVDLESYKQAITIRQWSDGTAEVSKKEPAAPEQAAVREATKTVATSHGIEASELQLVHAGHRQDADLDTKKPSNATEQEPIRDVQFSEVKLRGVAPPRYDGQEQKAPSPVTTTVEHIEHIEEGQLSTVQERIEMDPPRPKIDSRSQDWELADLQEQLALVRTETRLVNRLVALANEERRLLTEIRARRRAS